MLFMLTLISAHAGKLADGFRGVPFGPAAVLTGAPGQRCATTSDPEVRWECVYTLGEVEVKATYIVYDDLFYGVSVTPVTQTFGNALALRNVLEAAYGMCVPKVKGDTSVLPDCTWRDGTAVALWEYNRYSDRSSLVLFDMVVHQQVEARQAAKAAEAARGL